jgi:hypothetical protein
MVRSSGTEEKEEKKAPHSRCVMLSKCLRTMLEMNRQKSYTEIFRDLPQEP